jgi:hypothetical protein
MTASYIWAFPHLEVKPSADGLSNVVSVVHWRLIASDDGYSAEAYGSVSLSDPDPDTFTAFDDLTKADVQAWAESALNAQSEGEVSAVDQIKASLAEQIARAKAPPVVTMPAPWG